MRLCLCFCLCLCGRLCVWGIEVRGVRVWLRVEHAHEVGMVGDYVVMDIRDALYVNERAEVGMGVGKWRCVWAVWGPQWTNDARYGYIRGV